MTNIGVLELQGNYALHHKIFSDLGISSKGVKLPKDLDSVDGLVIPGGESTTMSLLLDTFRLRRPILDFAKENPIMGTCAGLIMMAKKIENESKVKPLEILDVTVNRNAYGRQIMSKKEPISMETPVGDEEDSSLGDFIEDKNALVPVDAAVKSSLRDTTTRILSSLTPREERVLRMRFGIGMNSDHTLEEAVSYTHLTLPTILLV